MPAIVNTRHFSWPRVTAGMLVEELTIPIKQDYRIQRIIGK